MVSVLAEGSRSAEATRGPREACTGGTVVGARSSGEARAPGHPLRPSGELRTVKAPVGRSSGKSVDWGVARTVEAAPPRRYNVAIIFKRAQGRGRITQVTGLREFMARHSGHVVVDALLRPGASRRDWKATLLSDGYLILRHPTWAGAVALSDEAARTITLYAGG